MTIAHQWVTLKPSRETLERAPDGRLGVLAVAAWLGREEVGHVVHVDQDTPDWPDIELDDGHGLVVVLHRRPGIPDPSHEVVVKMGQHAAGNTFVFAFYSPGANRLVIVGTMGVMLFYARARRAGIGHWGALAATHVTFHLPIRELHSPSLLLGLNQAHEG